MKLWLARRAGKCSIGATSAGTRWTLSSRPIERDQQPSSANGPRTISIPQILLHSGTNIRKATISSSLTMWSVPLPAAMETYECALMVFGASPIRFLRRPSEAPLLGAGPKRQWNAGASSAQASLSFSGRRVAWGRYGSSTVLRKPPSYQSVLLLLLLLISVDLAPPGTRLNTGDSFKSKTVVDNKRHTNAHQPLTSHSPTGVSIPPLSARFLPALALGRIRLSVQASNCAALLSQCYPNYPNC